MKLYSWSGFCVISNLIGLRRIEMRTIDETIPTYMTKTSDIMLNLLPENEKELATMQEFKKQVIAEVLAKIQGEIDFLKKY